tara:strand:- start:430 stop:2328 length:1899 start_codon:yes stop_codon:yes gene_type:complete
MSEYDPRLDPIFQPTPEELLAQPQEFSDPSGNSEVPVITGDEARQVLNAINAEDDEKENRATWSEVTKSGLLRAGAGIPQTFIAIAEGAGLAEQGSTANFTKQVLALEQMGDMNTLQAITREALTDILPLVAEIYATRGAKLMEGIKRTAGIGLASGYFRFIDNPDQAAATSLTRFLNSATNTVLGPLFFTAGLGAGRGFSYLTGSRGKARVGSSDIMPDSATREAAAESIERASQKEIVLSPGAASMNPAAIAKELQQGGNYSDEMIAYLSEIIGSNARNTDELIDELVSTIVPEGKGFINRIIGDLYEASNKDLMPVDVFKGFQEDPIIEDIIRKTLGKPADRAAYELYEPFSVGRFHYLIDQVQKQIDDLGGKGDVAANLINLKNSMSEAAKSASPKYAKANDFFQREQTALAVEKALKARGDATFIPSTNSASDFVSAFNGTEAKKELIFGIENLSDPKLKKEALQRMDFLLKLIPQVSKMESTLKSLLGGTDDLAARRGRLETGFLYTLDNFLNQNNREAFVKFMLDPSKSAERLRELMPPRNATSEEAIRAFSLIINDIFAEPAVESIYDVPYRAEDQEKLESTSIQSRAKTYDRLLRSGRLEEFMSSNPEAYETLKKASTAQVVI